MIRITVAILLLTATSASAQDLRVHHAPLSPAWSAPPTPPVVNHPAIELPAGWPTQPPTLQNQRNSRFRVQNKIFENLAYCSLRLTRTERLQNCRGV